MINFKEQVILIIYFLIFGMFLGAMFDILHYFLKRIKLKQIISYFIQLVFWMFMVVIICLYMLRISGGYFTIYSFLFFFLGIVIYNIFLRKNFLINLNRFATQSLKIYRRLKKIIIVIVFPKEVVIFFKRTALKFNKAFKLLFKKIFKRKIKGDTNEDIKETNISTSDYAIINNSEWL